MKNLIGLLLLILLLFFENSCSVQKKLVQTELYFGLSQNNGNIISDSIWNVFVQEEVSTVFSEGFTIIHSEGKWVDTMKNEMHSEPSRIISSVNKMSAVVSAKIDGLREKYKVLFQQESVLRVDKKASIDF